MERIQWKAVNSLVNALLIGEPSPYSETEKTILQETLALGTYYSWIGMSEPFKQLLRSQIEKYSQSVEPAQMEFGHLLVKFYSDNEAVLPVLKKFLEKHLCN